MLVAQPGTRVPLGWIIRPSRARSARHRDLLWRGPNASVRRKRAFFLYVRPNFAFDYGAVLVGVRIAHQDRSATLRRIMLPFTKRPGRGDESGDGAASVRGAAPVSLSVREPFPSAGDEDVTMITSTKALGDARPSPRPAAGALPIGSAEGPRPSARPVNVAHSESEGRGAARGLPKIVKRTRKATKSVLPTTISPSAVIRATLESASPMPSKARRGLGALTGFLESAGSAKTGAVSSRTALSAAPRQSPVSVPHLHRMPPSMNLNPPGAFPPSAVGSRVADSASPPHGPSTGGPSVGAGGVAQAASLPAHFMGARAAYSEGRVDPPGTAVTARVQMVGRPAASWVLALAAFGLFLGVAGVAFSRGSDGLGEASASFVDPSRAGVGRVAAASLAAVDPLAAEAQLGLAQVAPPVEAVTVSVVTTPAAAPVVAVAPVAVAPPPKAVFTPSRPSPAAFVRARPAPAPAQVTTAEDPAVVASPAKATKASKTSAKVDPTIDEEQRKALKALQESQLETSF